MSQKIAIENYLKEEPKFRERRSKDRGLVNLLMKQYDSLRISIDRGIISKDTVIAIVQDYASMDRMWRKTLEEQPELRGSDYDNKDQFEAKKLVELGYRAPINIGQGDAVEKETQQKILL